MRALLVAQFFVAATLCFRAAAAETNDAAIVETAEQIVALPEPIADPLEPLNRGLWEVNKGLMYGVIQPTSRGYRVIVPRPLRDGIRNAGHNLVYPKRVVNNMLQKRWSGARNETHRFLANTVFGLGGLFDVGTRWGIPRSEADFGQTFGTWGWRPQAYLMLPIAGPSNERDALGSVLDGLLNPLTYFPPYNYITYGITYNNLTDEVDDYVRLSKSDFDPYAVLRYAWTLKRESRGVALTFQGEQDPDTLETLQSVFFTFQDEKFPRYGQTHNVELKTSGRKLPFTVWLQSKEAPMIYVVPGLGSHRLGGGTLALAELLYNEGFSVTTVSSTYNYEFMELGSRVAMPGHTPTDAADLHTALGEIDSFLRQRHPDKIAKRALMGYSMGGFHTLYLAGQTNAIFDRYVAIDAPVNLDYSIKQLDNFFRSALEWPEAERSNRIEQTFLKVAALSSQLDKMDANSVIPFSALESRFLLGLAFRLNLRDIIFLSQLHTNQGVLQNPISEWRREPLYREILQLGFRDYLEKFVTPYYVARGIDLRDPEQYRRAVDLRGLADSLRANPNVHVIENANDVLLGQESLAWLRETFPAERLTVFERGGHLGNLNQREVQRAIIRTVEDLKQPARTTPKHTKKRVPGKTLARR